jgi:hypothetical protein
MCTTKVCENEVPEQSLLKTTHGTRFLKEKIHKESMQIAITAAGESTMEDFVIRMRYLRRNGTYGAHACVKCKFGPLEHYRCNDLFEFHKTGGYTNSCPKCGHFVNDVSELSLWDGSIMT